MRASGRSYSTEGNVLTDRFRINDLQMEGSSGSPGPNEGKRARGPAMLSSCDAELTRYPDTLYEIKKLQVLSYNP